MSECYVYEDDSWYCWYDDGSEQFGNPDGTSVMANIPGSASFNWPELADTGIDAALDILSRRGYIQPPATPRVITNTYPGAIPGVTASAGVNRGGLSTGFNISQNTLMLVAGGVLIFLFAKGRR